PQARAASDAHSPRQDLVVDRQGASAPRRADPYGPEPRLPRAQHRIAERRRTRPGWPRDRAAQTLAAPAKAEQDGSIRGKAVKEIYRRGGVQPAKRDRTGRSTAKWKSAKRGRSRATALVAGRGKTRPPFRAALQGRARNGFRAPGQRPRPGTTTL